MTPEEQIKQLEQQLKDANERAEEGWSLASKLVKQLLVKENRYAPQFVFDHPEMIGEELEKNLLVYLQSKYNEKEKV